MLQVLIMVKLRYKPNKLLGTLFEWYKYYICTVFFHGIRFKVKEKTKKAVVMTSFFVVLCEFHWCGSSSSAGKSACCKALSARVLSSAFTRNDIL